MTTLLQSIRDIGLPEFLTEEHIAKLDEPMTEMQQIEFIKYSADHDARRKKRRDADSS
jgi:hypothetical protein